MFLRFDATLNNRKFSDIAPEVILRDIVEQPEEVDLTTSRYASKSGQRVSAKVRTSLAVRLSFVIRAYDPARRAELRDLVAAWAKDGGILKINTRPGKHLLVTMGAAPALESSLIWTQDLQLTLTAYEIPYWVSDTAEVNTMHTEYTGSNIAGHEEFAQMPMSVPSNVTGYPLKEVKLTNVSTNGKVLTMMEINTSYQTAQYGKRKAQKTRMKLTGLNISPGETVRIKYDAPGLLAIKGQTGNDLLECRTPDSDDDLLYGADTVLGLSVPGDVVVWADCPVQCTVTAEGWWM